MDLEFTRQSTVRGADDLDDRLAGQARVLVSIESPQCRLFWCLRGIALILLEVALHDVCDTVLLLCAYDACLPGTAVGWNAGDSQLRVRDEKWLGKVRAFKHALVQPQSGVTAPIRTNVTAKANHAKGSEMAVIFAAYFHKARIHIPRRRSSR